MLDNILMSMPILLEKADMYQDDRFHNFCAKIRGKQVATRILMLNASLPKTKGFVKRGFD